MCEHKYERLHFKKKKKKNRQKFKNILVIYV